MDSVVYETYSSDEKLKFSKKDDILKVAEMPLFRHASGRTDKLKDLAEMYKVSANSGLLSDIEKEMIYDLSKQGYSTGEIRREIWEHLGIARSTRSIWSFRKREGLYSS
jgi:hypothetical protein